MDTSERLPGGETEVYVEAGTTFAKLAGLAPPRQRSLDTDHFDVVVIGAGQSGLSVGYHLARHALRFVILDAGERIGDAWRQRWDSLRLFTPARFDGLDGMAFPAPANAFPTKDEMADYLESYAERFSLPVVNGVRVEGLRRRGERYLLELADGRRLEADQVVVAMGHYQRPRVPPLAGGLAPEIVQLHSATYRKPSQLADGPVLLVGAGNSAAELAKELAPRHRIWMSGPSTGALPFRIAGRFGRLIGVRLVLRVLFTRVLSVGHPLGRRLRPKLLGAGPLIRVLPRDLRRLGVARVGRTTGTDHGKPRLDDGRVLDVANVIWCTGFEPALSWIDLPIFDDHGHPRHRSGVVDSAPGLYFVGLHFLHSMSSGMIHGVGRDAGLLVRAIAERAIGAGDRLSA